MSILVNGDKISEKNIEQEVQQMKSYYQGNLPNDYSDEQLKELAKNNLIGRTLLTQEVKASQLEVTEAEINQVYQQVKDKYSQVDEATLKDNIGLNLKQEKFLNEVTKGVEKPSEIEVKKIYDDNKEHFKKSEQVHAAHIVKNVEGKEKKEVLAEMEEIKVKLDEGESFEKLATEESDCPDNNGDLGFFPRGQMVQEFEDVVFSMGKDEISDVFLSPFGYHIAKVYEKKDAEIASFKEAKDYIVNEIVKRKKSQLIAEYVDELREKAEITEG